jgi:protein gp37
MGWRKGRRIFLCSMGDLFHEDVPDGFLDRVFATMALTPQHTYQVLTKRPARMREYLTGDTRYTCIDETASAISGESGVGVVARWPLPNVWLGTSVATQKDADTNIPELLRTPAAVRFISAEPLVEHVDLNGPWPGTVHDRDWLQMAGGLDWVIGGGESGTNARPFDLAWARSLRDQCREAGVPFFMKQVGRRPIGHWFDPNNPPNVRRPAAWKPHFSGHWRLGDSHGGDMDEWPEDLKVREMPEVSQ